MKIVQKWYVESTWKFISPQHMVQLEQLCPELLILHKDPAKVKTGEDQKQINQP